MENVVTKGAKAAEPMDKVEPSSTPGQSITDLGGPTPLILNCLQFKGNYFVRNIPPQFTEELCTTLDSAIDKLMSQCFGLKNEKLSTFNKTRIHLPIRLGGLGVRELSHVRCAEFIGGVMDGIPPLLPQHHDDGNFMGK